MAYPTMEIIGMAYKCPKCNDDNLLSDEIVFQPVNKVHVWMCKKCYKIYRKSIVDKYNNKPERKLKVSHYYRVKRYGLSIEEYNKKKELQLNGCAICLKEFKEERNIYIDHDHHNNQLRDLLCPRCNNILGMVDDDEELLFRFIEYLKRHSTKRVA